MSKNEIHNENRMETVSKMSGKSESFGFAWRMNVLDACKGAIAIAFAATVEASQMIKMKTQFI